MTDSSDVAPESNDWVLVALVMSANRAPGEVIAGVTLTVGGQVITGHLIGASDFYRAYGALWKTRFPTDFGESLFRTWNNFADRVQADVTAELKAEQDNPEAESAPPRFIHLSHARYVFGSNVIPATEGMLWRGKISDVSGFSLGVFEASKQP